jgi:hypothetical protein
VKICAACSAILPAINSIGFLKNHGVFYDYTMADFDREQETLSSLGF